MIDIQIKTTLGQKSLVLDQNTSIRIELNSSLFEQDFIPGSKSFTFEIPVCGQNNIIFKHPNFLNTNIKTKIYDCNFYISSILFFSGNLLLTKITKKKYSIQLNINYFVIDFKDRSIRDIDYGSDIYLGVDADAIVIQCNSYIAREYPNVLCQFPTIYNKEAYGEKNHQWYNVINDYDTITNLYKKNVLATGNHYALSPQPYLIHIIKQIFSNDGYTIDSSIFDDEDFKTLLLYSNYLLDELLIDVYYSYVQQTVEQTSRDVINIELPIDFSTKLSDADNLFNLTTDEYEITAGGYHEINLECLVKATGNYAQAEYKVRLYVDGTKYDYYEYTFGSQLYIPINDNFTYYAETADIGKKMYLSIDFSCKFDQIASPTVTYYLTGSYAKFYPRLYSNFNIYKSSFNIADIVPDVKISYFLNAVKNFFMLGVFFDFKRKSIKLIPVNELLAYQNYFEIDEYVEDNVENEFQDTQDYIYNFNFENDSYTTDNFKQVSDYYYIGEFVTKSDLPAASAENQLALVKNQNKYWIVINDSGLKWSPFTDNFLPFNTTGNIPFIPNISPLLMISNILAHYPKIEQLATSEAFNNINLSMGLKLMIWQGKLDDEPRASNNVYGPLGTIQGDLSLSWDDPTYGIYEKYHVHWHNFIKETEQIRVIGYFPAIQYLKLMSLFEPNSDNMFFIMYKKIKFLPKKISALVDNTGKDKIQVEIIMLKQGQIDI